MGKGIIEILKTANHHRLNPLDLPPGTVQPRTAPADRLWLTAIMRANRFDTWGEAAALVLAAVAADVAAGAARFANPVAADLPRRPIRFDPASIWLVRNFRIFAVIRAGAAIHLRAVARSGGFGSFSDARSWNTPIPSANSSRIAATRRPARRSARRHSIGFIPNGAK